MQVEIAAIFLASGSSRQLKEVIKTPIVSINGKIANGKIETDRKKIIIPAITNVAECNKAETGVGPSIASGNHKKENKETDLTTRAQKIKSIAYVSKYE